MPGRMSRHNSSYWAHKKYLGIGPGAHSFDGSVRSCNPSNNQQYLRGVEQGMLAKEQETLSDKNLYNESIMLGLRKATGIEVQKIMTNYDIPISQHFKLQAANLIGQGLLLDDGSHYRLSLENWYLADHISERLFYD